MPRENQNIVHREEETEKIYLEIGFQSDHHESTLRKIEILGVPGVHLENGKCILGEKDKRFFDDLIVRKLFSLSRRMEFCNYQYLKIWLWNSNFQRDKVPYRLPSINGNDFEIRAHNQSSKLRKIYVLDNGLKGADYYRWRNTAETLFSPLFDSFTAPPEPPSFLKESPLTPFIKAFASVNETIDPYANMKQKIDFNTLIIQID